MKICPSCGAKYPDDYLICYDCDIQMIDSVIAHELKCNGASNSEMLKNIQKNVVLFLNVNKRKKINISLSL